MFLRRDERISFTNAGENSTRALNRSSHVIFCICNKYPQLKKLANSKPRSLSFPKPAYTVYSYGLTTTAENSTRRRDDDDCGDETRHTLNYMLVLRDGRILFTKAGHKSVLRTPK